MIVIMEVLITVQMVGILFLVLLFWTGWTTRDFRELMRRKMPAIGALLRSSRSSDGGESGRSRRHAKENRQEPPNKDDWFPGLG